MRPVCLSALLAVYVLAATAPAQSEKDTRAAAATRSKKLQAKVSVMFDDTSLTEAMEELKAQVEFSYKLDTGVSRNLKITYAAKEKPLAQVLDGMFQKNGLGYYVVSNEKDRYDGWLIVRPGKERGYPAGHEPGKAAADKPAEKATAKAKAKEKPAEEGDKTEQEAARKLNLAKELAAAGKTEKARERYEDILRLYSKTKAADEARELLEKLKKK